jgi:hypothetical protein
LDEDATDLPVGVVDALGAALEGIGAQIVEVGNAKRGARSE